MRIIAEIPHPRMKISIFNMNDKLSIKFEKKLLEQIYKFREGSPLHDIEKLKSLCTTDFLFAVETTFNDMMKQRENASNMVLDSDAGFDEII